MSYRINLSKELYGWIANLYRPDHGPHVDPAFIVTSCAASMGIDYYDRDKAVKTYVDRIKDMFARIDVKLSKNICTAYAPDQPHAAAVYAMMNRIMGIDVTTIVRAYEDDGWVITPTGSIIQPTEWDNFTKNMNTCGTVDIYSQVTGIPGGTRQQIADRYAEIYQETYDKAWGPYDKEQS